MNLTITNTRVDTHSMSNTNKFIKKMVTNLFDFYIVVGGDMGGNGGGDDESERKLNRRFFKLDK